MQLSIMLQLASALAVLGPMASARGHGYDHGSALYERAVEALDEAHEHYPAVRSARGLRARAPDVAWAKGSKGNRPAYGRCNKCGQSCVRGFLHGGCPKKPPGKCE